MSYAIARAKLVTILEAVTPISTLRGLHSRFKHFPEAGEKLPPDARGFFIRAGEDGAGLVGPFTPGISGSPLLSTSIRITVAYPTMADDDVLDRIIEEDRRQITRALLSEANWGTGADGICWLTDTTPLMPAFRELDDGGTTLLTFVFDLVYR